MVNEVNWRKINNKKSYKFKNAVEKKLNNNNGIQFNQKVKIEIKYKIKYISIEIKRIIRENMAKGITSLECCLNMYSHQVTSKY